MRTQELPWSSANIEDEPQYSLLCDGGDDGCDGQCEPNGDPCDGDC